MLIIFICIVGYFLAGIPVLTALILFLESEGPFLLKILVLLFAWAVWPITIGFWINDARESLDSLYRVNQGLLQASIDTLESLEDLRAEQNNSLEGMQAQLDGIIEQIESFEAEQSSSLGGMQAQLDGIIEQIESFEDNLA